MPVRPVTVLLLLVALALPRTALSQACHLVQDEDFDQYAGPWRNYTRTMMETDFGPSVGRPRWARAS